MIRSAFCTMYPSLNSRALGLDLPAKATLELASEAGFEGVDLMVRDIVESGGDVRELRARMNDLGLRGGGPGPCPSPGERTASDSLTTWGDSRS
jgi:sugar phosphate isomerase/epimerase